MLSRLSLLSCGEVGDERRTRKGLSDEAFMVCVKEGERSFNLYIYISKITLYIRNTYRYDSVNIFGTFSTSNQPLTDEL